MEVRQGVISFQSWIKDKLRDELINLMQHPGCGWQNVQELAGKYGLQIREHKTGLVFSHVSAKLFVLCLFPKLLTLQIGPQSVRI